MKDAAGSALIGFRAYDLGQFVAEVPAAGPAGLFAPGEPVTVQIDAKRAFVAPLDAKAGTR